MKIFFDVDGVLIDGWHTDPARRKPWSRTLALDLGIDPEALQREFFQPRRDGIEPPMWACLRGKRDLKEALADVLPTIGFGGSIDEFVSYWLRKDSNINRESFDAVAKLSARQDVALYVATNQEHYRAAHLWNELGFKRYFKQMFHSARIGRMKTDPGYFDAINRELDIDAAECPLFFDDDPMVVAVAKTCGWDGVVFKTIDDLRDHPRICNLFQEST